MEQRPLLYVGSSSEGLAVAEAVQLNLEHECEVALWSQGVFGLSEGTLQSLVEKLPMFDFAVLVLTPDDLTHSRGASDPSPRDNVLIELGLCIGILGRERTFAVYDRSAHLKLPTDLAGVTMADYQPPAAVGMQAALGAACTNIKLQVKKLGRRVQSGRAASTAPMENTVLVSLVNDLHDLVSEAEREARQATHPRTYRGFLARISSRMGTVFAMRVVEREMLSFPLPGRDIELQSETQRKFRRAAAILQYKVKSILSAQEAERSRAHS